MSKVKTFEEAKQVAKQIEKEEIKWLKYDELEKKYYLKALDKKSFIFDLECSFSAIESKCKGYFTKQYKNRIDTRNNYWHPRVLDNFNWRNNSGKLCTADVVMSLKEVSYRPSIEFGTWEEFKSECDRVLSNFKLMIDAVKED